jgi:hypothetical protein
LVCAPAAFADGAFAVAASALAATVSVVAAFVDAAAAFVLAAPVLVLDAPWANTAPDHATDPNIIAATPASPRALVNVIVFIVAPRCSKTHRESHLLPTIIGRGPRGNVKSLWFMRRRSTACMHAPLFLLRLCVANH